jgi:hypothetical protein
MHSDCASNHHATTSSAGRLYLAPHRASLRNGR